MSLLWYLQIILLKMDIIMLVFQESLHHMKLKQLSDVKTITKTQYEQVLKTYPVITELYAAIKEFYEILYSRCDERLETWIEK